MESFQNRQVKLGGGISDKKCKRNKYHTKINLYTKFYPNQTMETCSNPEAEAEFMERGSESENN